MKRRRGSKKGRLKKQPKLVSTNKGASTAAVGVHTEENSGGADDDDVDSGMDAETEPTPSPPRPSQPETLANADTLGRPNSSNIFGKAVYTRVKVKIKKSKTLESQRTSPSQSDTDKSSQQAGSEKPGLPPSERIEDSANSLSETNGGVSGNTIQKAAGIKIKSSRGLGSSSMSPCSNTEQPRRGDMVEKKDVKFLEKDSKNNEQELVSALEVIIMLVNDVD